jgi:hypothetical protein
MSAQPTAGDDQLTEYLIDHCYQSMMAAATTAEQKYWCARMTFYIGRRSPERIREMEINKGLV